MIVFIVTQVYLVNNGWTVLQSYVISLMVLILITFIEHS